LAEAVKNEDTKYDKSKKDEAWRSRRMESGTGIPLATKFKGSKKEEAWRSRRVASGTRKPLPAKFKGEQEGWSLQG
jgi:hypothetical protein